MIFRVFIFILFYFFRSNGTKVHLDENDFRHGYVNYFKSTILKVTWYQLYSKFFLNNCPTNIPRWNDVETNVSTSFQRGIQVERLKGTEYIDNCIWKTPYSWRFYGHGSTWVNITKRKWAKMPWKSLVAQKFEPVLWRTLH